MKSEGFKLIYIIFLILSSCNRVNEKDKIFHAGPSRSGFGVIYFGLYNNNRYQFCDGDFMDPGCYTGKYSLSGDTIILDNLKIHKGIPSNRLLIRRYAEMDSTYWQWKYPDYADKWQDMKKSNLMQGAEGDVLTLDNNGRIAFDPDNYFLIRFDKLKNNS